MSCEITSGELHSESLKAVHLIGIDRRDDLPKCSIHGNEFVTFDIPVRYDGSLYRCDDEWVFCYCDACHENIEDEVHIDQLSLAMVGAMRTLVEMWYEGDTEFTFIEATQ